MQSSRSRDRPLRNAKDVLSKMLKRSSKNLE